jgi:hypothetical protein
MFKQITGPKQKDCCWQLGCCFCASMQAQKYFTKNGNISFFSKTNIENISADNNQVVSVLNSENRRIAILRADPEFSFQKIADGGAFQ